MSALEFAGVRRLRRALSPAIWTLLLVAVGTLLGSTLQLAARSADNRKIAALLDGYEVPVDADAQPVVLLARIDFLLYRERLDEAYPLVEQVAQRGTAQQAAQALYNRGNARARQVLAQIQAGQLNQAVSGVGLAKADYRRALRLQPELWDARYNLDVATMMLRDFGEAVPREGDDEQPQKPEKLWSDLPGVPRGLP
jgi:mxaK protein